MFIHVTINFTKEPSDAHILFTTFSTPFPLDFHQTSPTFSRWRAHGSDFARSSDHERAYSQLVLDLCPSQLTGCTQLPSCWQFPRIYLTADAGATISELGMW